MSHEIRTCTCPRAWLCWWMKSTGFKNTNTNGQVLGCVFFNANPSFQNNLFGKLEGLRVAFPLIGYIPSHPIIYTPGIPHCIPHYIVVTLLCNKNDEHRQNWVILEWVKLESTAMKRMDHGQSSVSWNKLCIYIYRYVLGKISKFIWLLLSYILSWIFISIFNGKDKHPHW
jgi:hypothetical protein